MNPTAGVLSEAWGLYKAHWKHLIPIALVVHLALALLGLLLVELGLIGILLAAMVSIVGYFWVQGALVKTVEDIRDGTADMSMGQTFAAVGPFVPAIAGASILAGFGIVLGFIALIVPGLILMTLWSVIIPAIVVEGKGAIGSFGRSMQLVRPHAMSVFGVILLTLLLGIAFGIVLGLILGFLPEKAEVYISDVVSGALTAPFVALTWTILFFRLRDAQGGTTLPPTGTTGTPGTMG